VAASGETASVNIGKVTVSASSITTHDTIAVLAPLSASEADASGIDVNFYDGDPQQGGTLFDVERMPFIEQDSSFTLQTSFQTSPCGVHQVFVTINEGQASEVVRRAPPVRVVCSQSMLRTPVGSAGQKLYLK